MPSSGDLPPGARTIDPSPAWLFTLVICILCGLALIIFLFIGLPLVSPDVSISQTTAILNATLPPTK